MNRIILLLLIFNLASCNSQKKEKNIVEFSCECITGITENDDKAKLLAKVQNCISDGYVKYDDYLEDLANKYFEKNPNAELTEAQNWIRKILTEKLVKGCPRFSDIVSDTAFKDRNSTDLIKEIASQVCAEINDLGDTKLNWKVIDPIFIRQMNRFNKEINASYDLTKKVGMDNYSRDLVQELVATCEKYKEFTLKTDK